MSIKVKINNDWVDTNIKAVRGVNHVNSEDVYTKEETEKKFATKTEVQTQINNSITKENIENTIEAWLEEDNETTNGEVYTKAESDALFSGKVSKSDIVQSTGTSEMAVMSQKAVSDKIEKVDAVVEKTRNLAYPVEVLKDYYISSDGKFATESDLYSVLIQCQPNTTYTLSKVLTTRFRIATFKNKPTLFAQGTLIGSPQTSTHYSFTTDSNANYIMAWVLNSSGETKTIDDVLASLQLELGNEVTPYIKPFVVVDTETRTLAESVRNDLEQHIKDTNFIEKTITTDDVTKGYYRVYNGSLGSSSAWFYSKPIWLEKGEVVKTNEAITLYTSICVICSVDKENNFESLYLRGSNSAEIINFVAPYSGYFGISALNSNLDKFVIVRNGINKSVEALLEDTKGCGIQSLVIDEDQKIKGYYRIASGQLPVHDSYMYSIPIYMTKGDRITTISPINIVTQVAFISKVDKDNNFISLLKAGTGTEQEYDYEVTENGYVSISCTNIHSGYVLIKKSNINDRVENLYSLINNNDNPFTLGADKLITINDNPLSMIIRGASYAGLIHSWGIVGDSLSSGEMQCYDSTSTSATDYKFVDMYQWSWGQRFAKLNGVDAYNFSNGGQTTWGWIKSQGQVHDASYIGGVGGGDWRHAQLAENRKDGYIIALAVNDRSKIQSGEYALGEASHIMQYDGTDNDIDDTSTNPKSFYRYYAGIIQRLKSVSPKAKIFCVTPLGSNYDELSSAIRNIVDLYEDVYLIDLAKYCPISWSGAYYMNGHGSAMGYEYTAYEINTYIDWIIRKNFDEFKGTALIGTDYRDKY